MALALVLVVLLPALAVVLVLGAPGVRPARRSPLGWRLGGLAAGTALAVLVDRVADLGRGTMLAVPLVALGLLSGVLLGETRRLAPAEGPRAAPLQTRRVADHVPWRLTAAVAAALGALVGLLVAGALLGSADDVGRAGRALAIACGGGLTQRRTPWPGAFYALPLAAVLAGGLLAAGLAAHAVVRRPLRLSAGDSLDADRDARSRSVADVVAALGVLVAVPLAGVATFAAGALHGIGCRPASWTALMVVALAALAGGLVLLVACTATVLQPARAAGRASVPMRR